MHHGRQETLRQLLDHVEACGHKMCLQCLSLLCTWQLGVLGMLCHEVILFLPWPLLALACSSDGACALTLPPEPWLRAWLHFVKVPACFYSHQSLQ